MYIGYAAGRTIMSHGPIVNSGELLALLLHYSYICGRRVGGSPYYEKAGNNVFTRAQTRRLDKYLYSKARQAAARIGIADSKEAARQRISYRSRLAGLQPFPYHRFTDFPLRSFNIEKIFIPPVINDFD